MWRSDLQDNEEEEVLKEKDKEFKKEKDKEFKREKEKEVKKEEKEKKKEEKELKKEEKKKEEKEHKKLKWKKKKLGLKADASATGQYTCSTPCSTPGWFRILSVLVKCGVTTARGDSFWSSSETCFFCFPAGDLKPIFGVPLVTAVERSKSHDGVPLPIIVRETIDYIEEFGECPTFSGRTSKTFREAGGGEELQTRMVDSQTGVNEARRIGIQSETERTPCLLCIAGLTCEGIYRISGVKSKVQGLKEAYNKGTHVYLHEYEPNVVASLLKQFLRDLPEPVLTADLMPKFEQASSESDLHETLLAQCAMAAIQGSFQLELVFVAIKNVKQKVEQFQKLLEELPPPNRCLLSSMIVHMTHIIAKV